VSQRQRRPALAPPPIRPAVARSDNPSAFLEQHYQHVWQTRMRGLPFVNSSLEVEVIEFVRHEGDWLGVIVTPWFLNLFLLSGGGSLWSDIAAGERCHVQLPCGRLQFIADDDPDIGPYQYCPLIAPVSELPDAGTAHQAALDALKAVLTAAPEIAPDVTPPEPVEASRRGFLRRMAGHK
jgi:[NiFe] hydrogenase assembly HybE family chaperone